MADKQETAEKTIARLERERDEAREEIALKCCRAGDDGNCETILVASVRRLERERHQSQIDHDLCAADVKRLEADRAAVQSALDAAMVDHSRLEAERATEAHRADSMLDRCRELEAQLAALAAEHESAARAAEERIAKLALLARAAFGCCDVRYQAEPLASLAEVKP